MVRDAANGRQRGFTLVEVLVALAILGLVAASIVALIGQNTRFIADQEEKMLAGMLVDTVTVEALARETPMERGEAVAERAFAGRNWQVKTTVVEAGVASVIRIETSVTALGETHTLARATTLKSEGPKP